MPRSVSRRAVYDGRGPEECTGPREKERRADTRAKGGQEAKRRAKSVHRPSCLVAQHPRKVWRGPEEEDDDDEDEKDDVEEAEKHGRSKQATHLGKPMNGLL